MELQRQDYPGMLAHLQPSPAVRVLNDRLKYIESLNNYVADWLTERRRIEDVYASSLRKLAGRPFGDPTLTDLGVFQVPWQKIVASTESLAKTHHNLAQNISADVEIPLRSWRAKDMDTNVLGNIQAIAKELENAEKKSAKLATKGGKADTGKVAVAASSVENALGQWESQAPYVFERLQATDEARVDHLRNVLTQYQTHVIEAGTALSGSAEESLNTLLNLQTADEIKTFAMKSTKLMPTHRRRQSTLQEAPPPPTTDSGPSSAPMPPLPAPTSSMPPPPRGSDRSSHRSNSFQETPDRSEAKSEKGKFGLKRLGTVISRRRQSIHPYAQSRSPERKKSTNDVRSSPFARFGRKESHQQLETVPSPGSSSQPTADPLAASRNLDRPPQLDAVRSTSLDGLNGISAISAREASLPPAVGLTNGNGAPAPSGALQEPLKPAEAFEPPKDADGFTIPPPGHDPMQQALDEAAEGSQSHFKVDIKNAPIKEDDGDASAVMAGFASALQSQPNPRRSMIGTTRNRRDRNTIMFTNPPSIPGLPTDPLPSNALPPMPPMPVPFPDVPQRQEVSSPAPVDPSASTTSLPPLSASQTLPFKLSQRSTLGLDDYASDTHSIRSSRSMGSVVSASVRHPELTDPGLNSSFMETLSASFADGKVTKAGLTGEIALAFNPTSLDVPFGTDTVRLENLSASDKLAPNPAFIDSLPAKPGHFTVALAQITKTQVAFKYQVHLGDGLDAAAKVPLLLHAQWRIEGKQADCRLHYSLNPEFASDSVALSNVTVIVHVDTSAGGRPVSCRASENFKFRRDAALVYWRLGDVALTKEAPPKPLLARFLIEGEVKPGSAEARWEMLGALASRIRMERIVEEGKGKATPEEDPFADEDEEGSAKDANKPGEVWGEVTGVKKLRSGTYTAVA